MPTRDCIGGRRQKRCHDAETRVAHHFALHDMLHIRSLGAQPHALRLGFGAAAAGAAVAGSELVGGFFTAPPPV